MKKTLIFLIALVFTFMLGSCKKTKEEKETYKDIDFTYYQSFPVNKDKKLYVYGGDNLSFEDNFTGQVIQGLKARTGSMYFCDSDERNHNWLVDLCENYGFTSEPITILKMVQNYQDEYKTKAGFITYDSNNLQSINVATSLCGIKDLIPVEKKDVNKYLELGLKEVLNVCDKTEKWCFETYRDEFNNDGIVQQRKLTQLRDYAVSCKYFCFYPDSKDLGTIKFRGTVHAWLKDDTPIFGWGPFEEDSHVGVASQNGQFTIPSDFNYNLSLFSSKDIVNKEVFMQPNKKLGVKAQQGKHYVCITRSDGDNIQTWANYFPWDNKDMAATRSNFPMGWTIEPSLADLAPNILDYVYRTSDKNDYYVCGVSGQGYIFPQIYPEMQKFTEGLSAYLKKADLNVIQILDSGFNEEVIEYYSKVKEVKGGMYLFGDKYAGGKGSIYWSQNGKPFISCRETLWNADPVAVAEKINGYEKDPSSIYGYTFVNLHPWSMSYQDVVTMVENFSSDVVVVSPEDFIDLIIENVPHENVIIK